MPRNRSSQHTTVMDRQVGSSLFTSAVTWSKCVNVFLLKSLPTLKLLISCSHESKLSFGLTSWLSVPADMLVGGSSFHCSNNLTSREANLHNCPKVLNKLPDTLTI